MPTVVLRRLNKLEPKECFEWSWPDHAPTMTDGEARIRAGRAERPPRGYTRTRNLDGDALATEYGKLLEEGNARVQQTTPSGDNLPRNVRGELLGIKQEIATDIAEVRNDWPAEVYDTDNTLVPHDGPAPDERWGATNEQGMSTWLPEGDRPDQEAAVATARALEGATHSRAVREIAWCANLKPNDDGDIWREAVARGRNTEGQPGDIAVCAQRTPGELVVSQESHRDDYEAENDGPHRIVLHVPDRNSTGIEAEADDLYAAARGSLCTEYGPPLTNDEKALDALAASIITSRGTNGAGTGWSPREPELLVEAGRELQRNPGRLHDLVNHVETVERSLYPPWPDRERELEREKPPEREDERDTFDRERARYYRDVRMWEQQQQRERDREREPHRKPPPRERQPPHPEVPQRERRPTPPGVKLPGYNPDDDFDKWPRPRPPVRDTPGPKKDKEPPAPERTPTKERDTKKPAREPDPTPEEPEPPEPPTPERAPSPTRETPREPNRDTGRSR